MADRSKTVLILGTATLLMFSPLAMVLAGYPIRMFQDLGFARESIAPPIVWISRPLEGSSMFLTTRAIPLLQTCTAKSLVRSVLAVVGVSSNRLHVGMVRACFVPTFMRSPASHLSGYTSCTYLQSALQATLPAIISTSILGIFLAIVYLVGGRNLGPCIFADVLINIVIDRGLCCLQSQASGADKRLQLVASRQWYRRQQAAHPRLQHNQGVPNNHESSRSICRARARRACGAGDLFQCPPGQRAQLAGVHAFIRAGQGHCPGIPGAEQRQIRGHLLHTQKGRGAQGTT